MVDPTISVIIATNRGGPYLEQAVASVRAQSYSALEIILVDDGSPAPGLREDAERLDLIYVRQAASGVSVARNRGAAVAQGDWIAYLDDDDVWDPHRLAVQREVLVERPDAVVCYSGGWYMDSEGKSFGKGWPGGPAAAKDMLRGAVDIPRIITMLIRRDECLALGGFNPSFRLAEDDELILRLLQVGPFVGVDRELVGYRRHSGNVTNQAIARQRDASRHALDLLIWGARSRGDSGMAHLLTENLKRYLRRNSADTVGTAIAHARAGDYAQASREMAWGLAHAPGAATGALWRRIVRRP